MPLLTRRGTTLVELLVALTLLGVLGATVVAVLRGIQNAYRAQTLAADRAQSLRVAAALLPAELRELDAAGGDIVRMDSSAITIRAPRQFAALCRPPEPTGPVGGLALTVRDRPRYGLRDFNSGTDSVLLFRATAAESGAGGRWVPGSIASRSAAPCPDGSPGERLTLAPDPALMDDHGVETGTPVLGFETTTYRLYRSSEDRRWYVGQQTGSDLQPVLGPVSPAGLAFAYFDSTGAPTADPVRVALIEIRVRAPTTEPIRTREGRLALPVDSVVLVVTLRNNPHG